jgi:hypothetical protein
MKFEFPSQTPPDNPAPYRIIRRIWQSGTSLEFPGHPTNRRVTRPFWLVSTLLSLKVSCSSQNFV